MNNKKWNFEREIGKNLENFIINFVGLEKVSISKQEALDIIKFLKQQIKSGKMKL